MFKILKTCSATIRRSLQGLDYFLAEGGRSFDDLIEIVSALSVDSEETKRFQHLLLESKRYLKTDYKVIMKIFLCPPVWKIRGHLVFVLSVRPSTGLVKVWLKFLILWFAGNRRGYRPWNHIYTYWVWKGKYIGMHLTTVGGPPPLPWVSTLALNLETVEIPTL